MFRSQRASVMRRDASVEWFHLIQWCVMPMKVGFAKVGLKISDVQAECSSGKRSELVLWLPMCDACG
jgi:hypothetical protein